MSQSVELHDEHLSQRLLDDFFVGERSLSELGVSVLDHLVNVCSDCRRELHETCLSFRDVFAAAEGGGRAIAQTMAQERSELPELLSGLLSLGVTAAVVQVANDRRLQTVAFVEHQLEIGWQGLEQGETSVVSGALTLGSVAVRGIKRARYTRELLRTLEAELWLLAARERIVHGALDDTRAFLLSAARLLRRAGRPPDLVSLQLLTAAELRLAQGRVAEARALGSRAAELARSGESPRWLLSSERLVARIDRLEGRPREAADRLIRLLGEEGPREREQWSAAREVFFALIEAAEVEEASGWLATWWGDAANGRGAGSPSTESWFEAWSHRAWADTDEHAERELILGVVLGHLGKRRAARSLLESARRQSLRRGRGRDAMVATLELLRLHGVVEDLEAVRAELSDLHELAMCRDVPRTAVRELVRLAADVWQGGKLGDITRVERALALLLKLEYGRLHGPS